MTITADFRQLFTILFRHTQGLEPSFFVELVLFTESGIIRMRFFCT